MSVTGLGRVAMAEKMSVTQLKEALENKTLPAYIAAPLLEEKLDMQEHMRTYAMMRQAQQSKSQPPILDRVVQRAKTAGIDQLPSNLTPTQDLAGGGIVAFGGGGEIPRYAGPYYGSLVKDPYAQPETQRIPGRGFSTPQADPEDIRRQLAQIDAQINATPSGRGRVFLENKRNELRTALGMAPIVGAPRPESSAAAPEAPKVDARLPDTAVAPPAPAPSPKTPSGATGDRGIASSGSKPFVIEPRPEFPKLSSSDAMDVTKGIMEGPQGYLARSEARETKLMEALGKDRLQGKAFEGYEKTLRDEGIQAGLDKTQAKYMAMLKAGLAIMSGTSRHALENIGKGAMVGAADYQEAYKDFRKAERERTKEFALIEQARRAEDRDDLKRRDELLMRASDAAQKRDDFGTNALVNAGIEDTRAARDLWKTQYSAAFDVWKTKETIGAQERIAKERNAALIARGAGRNTITPYQLAQLRKEAIKNVDEGQIRADLAKAAKLSKTPRPGEDASFDARVTKAYETKLNQYMEGLLGVSSGNPFAGYSLED